VRWGAARGGAADEGPSSALGGARAGRAHGRFDPVELEVGSAGEAGDLVDTLWRRGIPSRLAERGGRWQVEVRSPREEPLRLVAELATVLRPWLVEHGRASLPLRVARRRYTLHAELGLLDDRAARPAEVRP
jgi:hypothetical protein